MHRCTLSYVRHRVRSAIYLQLCTGDIIIILSDLRVSSEQNKQHCCCIALFSQ